MRIKLLGLVVVVFALGCFVSGVLSLGKEQDKRDSEALGAQARERDEC